MKLKLPVLVALAAFAVCLAFAVTNPLVEYDTMVRYAPMAEAFAQGNWQDAFHVRFGVLSSAVSGLLCKCLGVDGLSACVILAALGWALCVLPIYIIGKTVFDERTAWFAVALYLICPLTLQYAFKGLREPLKMLGVLLMAAGVFQALERQSDKPCAGLVNAVTGGVLLCLIKVDTVLFAALLWMFFAGVDRFRRSTWILALALALAVQVPCWQVWRECGWWVPSIQLQVILQRMLA